MNCINLRIRSKKYQKYYYCKLNKKEINIRKCKNCLNKEYKRIRKIKNKSPKLKRLEKNRYSILTDNYEKCYICPKKKKHIHEIFGGRNRQISMIHGFTVPLCEECHRKTEEDMIFDKKLKIECQEKYIKTHSKEEFISLIGKFYLMEEGNKNEKN